MVERIGFNKKIGQIAIGNSGGNPFLGQWVYLNHLDLCICSIVAAFMYLHCKNVNNFCTIRLKRKIETLTKSA